MTPLFFYGTLCHLPLLETVLGHASAVTSRASLPDHRVVWAEGHSFPLIIAASGHTADGLLVMGLGDADVARLDFYEGGFGYDLVPVTVQGPEGPVAARVYRAQDGLWQPGAPWSLADWVRDWGAMTVSAAGDFMRQCGQIAPDRARAVWPFLLARGWARQMAARPAPVAQRSGMSTYDLEFVERSEGYEGFFALRSFDVRFRRFDGGWAGPVQREAFMAFDAALVLPYDPVRDTVLLIEQLRFGPILRHDPHPWILEPVAGLVDAGETPEDCARREAVEEAGLTLRALEPMTRVYAAPGYSSEFFHCFLGLADLSSGHHRLAGLAGEAEDIRSHILSFDTAMDLLDSGEVNAGPLAMMLLWLARHRDRLRAAG